MKDKEEKLVNETTDLKTRVKNKIKEDSEKAKKMSEIMRDNKKRELKSKHIFINAINDAKVELEEGLNFIKRIDSEPILLFTDSYKYLKSTRGMIYSVMNHWKHHDDNIKGHDFQVYLADIANMYFQQWLKLKKIEGPYKIEVRNSMQFPSIFAIYYDDIEMLQFNLFERWYGVRNRPLTEEEILIKHNKEINRIDENIKEQEDKIKDFTDRRDNPLKHYKGIKNYISWLFINKKKLYDSFDKYVKREKSFLEHLEEEKERNIQYLPLNINDNKENNDRLVLLEPFFKELEYELNTNKSSLY